MPTIRCLRCGSRLEISEPRPGLIGPLSMLEVTITRSMGEQRSHWSLS